MIVALVLLAVGLVLSAFFSGSETGFYRVPRVRLLVDAVAGQWRAKLLLWLTNNPAIFVATTLVGNNIANYLVSLAIVLGVHSLGLANPAVVELAAPIVLSPILFVYGELLPKNLFYQAPYRLLRLGAPPFALFTVLFAPATALLWTTSRLLQRLLGEAPDVVQVALARKEIHRLLQEGQDVGVLQPAQRAMAHGLFSVASAPIVRYMTPIERVPPVRLGAARTEVVRLARRQRLTAIPVSRADGRRLIGYVRTIDLHLSQEDELSETRPLVHIAADETYVGALVRLYQEGESLAAVVDGRGDVIGLVWLERLLEPLERGQ